jgi:hypothetical protein
VNHIDVVHVSSVIRDAEVALYRPVEVREEEIGEEQRVEVSDDYAVTCLVPEECLVVR